MSKRPFFSYTKIQRLVGLFIRDRAFQYTRRSLQTKKYLNIGCGTNIFPSFVNLDYSWRPGIDLCCDISHGVHFQDNRFLGIYTEHCLEHLSFECMVNVLHECYRILKTDGIIRIAVPDCGLYLDLYQKAKEGKQVVFPYVGQEGLRDKEEDAKFGVIPMMAVNRIFHGYGHRFGYDEEVLLAVLRNVGFKHCQRVDFRIGGNPDLLIDSELRKPQSLYIEGVK